MKQGKVTGKWKTGKSTVKVNLPIMFFKEDDVVFGYIPVLDLSGYGKNQKEALASLDTVLQNYFYYTINKNTLVQDLESHGWTVQKKKKPYIAPALTKLINTNEYLHDIFNTKEYTMKRINVDLPELV